MEAHIRDAYLSCENTSKPWSDVQKEIILNPCRLDMPSCQVGPTPRGPHTPGGSTCRGGTPHLMVPTPLESQFEFWLFYLPPSFLLMQPGRWQMTAQVLGPTPVTHVDMAWYRLGCWEHSGSELGDRRAIAHSSNSYSAFQVEENKL